MNDLTADFRTVPFDLYRDIHKAIRVALFEVTGAAGRVDPSDREARVAHAAQVRHLAWLLKFHAEHEDTHIATAIAMVLPDRAAEIAADHVDLEERMDRLVAVAGLAADATRSDDRAAVHHLYLELASFTSAYLAHQDLEERVVMPALTERYGIEVLVDIHNAILASVAPEDMATCLAMMLPAMNNCDRAEMLGAMQAEAPPEVFAGVKALAAQVLSAADIAVVEGRIAPSPATVG